MTQRVEDHHLNGFPSLPRLFETMLSIENRLGGLQAGQDFTIGEVRRGFDKLDHHIGSLQGRVSTLEAAPPKPASRTLRDRMGLSVKELIGLALLAAMGLAGTLESSLIAAWLR